MKTTILALIFLFLCSGCATTMSPAAHQIRPADDQMTTGCLFLGEVQGSSGWGNLAASQGMQNARNEAQEQAAKLGATHIAWMNISGGHSPFAIGKAYRCN